tara:strand:- start:1050 stop:1358 length:309 start_codon:yes stop_codon:yes gene_type:complete
MANLYCVAASTEKGFITSKDRNNFNLSGYPGDVMVVEDNADSRAWITRVGSTMITKAEAQAIADAKVDEYKVAWDALTEAEKTNAPSNGGADILEPIKITLP